jgi:hypothetical protein
MLDDVGMKAIAALARNEPDEIPNARENTTSHPAPDTLDGSFPGWVADLIRMTHNMVSTQDPQERAALAADHDNNMELATVLIQACQQLGTTVQDVLHLPELTGHEALAQWGGIDLDAAERSIEHDDGCELQIEGNPIGCGCVDRAIKKVSDVSNIVRGTTETVAQDPDKRRGSITPEQAVKVLDGIYPGVNIGGVIDAVVDDGPTLEDGEAAHRSQHNLRPGHNTVSGWVDEDEDGLPTHLPPPEAPGAS